MVLKFYYDILSQPCRAVYILLKASGIPFESHVVAIRKGEHKSSDFLKINPQGKVPVINDDGFCLTESVAILKYLSDKYAPNDSLYPRNLQLRAKVDEYCAWYHLNTRMRCAKVFFMDVVMSRPREEIEQLESEMQTMLDDFEVMFLRDKEFIVGDKVTIADILAVCEMLQVSATGRDMFVGRTTLQSWMERVRSAANPHFDEAHSVLYRLINKRKNHKL